MSFEAFPAWHVAPPGALGHPSGRWRRAVAWALWHAGRILHGWSYRVVRRESIGADGWLPPDARGQIEFEVHSDADGAPSGVVFVGGRRIGSIRGVRRL